MGRKKGSNALWHSHVKSLSDLTNFRPLCRRASGLLLRGGREGEPSSAGVFPSGRYAEVGSWGGRRGDDEIDIVAVNGDKREILFAEVRREGSDWKEAELRGRAFRFLAQTPKYGMYAPRFACLVPEDL